MCYRYRCLLATTRVDWKGGTPHIRAFCWGKKLHSILKESVYQLIVNRAAKGTYRNDVLLVPPWIAIVNQRGEREEQVERKLENFKIGTPHLPFSDYLG